MPPEKWEAFEQVCSAEGVEATILGKFVPTGRLELKYEGVRVADLAMDFLHEGRPPVIREAHYQPAPQSPLTPAFPQP